MPVFYHFNPYLFHLFIITIAPLIHELQWSSLLSLRYFAVLSALKTSLCQKKNSSKNKFFSSKKKFTQNPALAKRIGWTTLQKHNVSNTLSWHKFAFLTHTSAKYLHSWKNFCFLYVILMGKLLQKFFQKLS